VPELCSDGLNQGIVVVTENLIYEIGSSIKRQDSFQGLVPTEYSSAETFRRGYVTKEGRKVLRTVWVEVAHVALRMKNHRWVGAYSLKDWSFVQKGNNDFTI